MTKKEMIQTISDAVEVSTVKVHHIYGVPMGVGYDYTVYLEMKESGELQRLKCHAGPRAWEMPGHLQRQEYRYNTYKGTDTYPERYIEKIQKYWESKRALEYYFMRFKKDQLQQWIDQNIEA